jgi:hypothetical protein
MCKQATVWWFDVYLQRASDQQVAGLDRIAGREDSRLSRRTGVPLDQTGTLEDHAVDPYLFSCGEGHTAVILSVGGLSLLHFQCELGAPAENPCFGRVEPLLVQGAQQHIDGTEILCSRQTAGSAWPGAGRRWRVDARSATSPPF